MAGDGSATESTTWGGTRLRAHSAAHGIPVAPVSIPKRGLTAAMLVRIRVVGVGLAGAAPVVLGLLFRLIAADRLSLQIDEPASLLGARAIVEHGVPILPSGTLYLHGATLSYLLAPLVWLGFNDIADLHTLRLVNAVIGTLAIVLAFRIGLLATGRTLFALAAALLVAIDPISVQWSAHLRMYALLQVLTLAIALVFLHAIDNGRKLPILLGTLFFIASFTHVGVALLWPPMVLVAMLVHGRTLLGANRQLGLGLLLCLVGPLLFVTMNHLFAPAGRIGSAGLFGSILDDQSFLTLERLLRPSLGGWWSLFRSDWYAGLMPALLAILSGIVLGRYFLTENRSDGEAGQRRTAGALLAFHWIPVLLLGILTTERQSRYTMNIYPFGLVLAVLALSLLVQTGWRMRRTATHGSWAPILAAGLAVAVIAANLGQGLYYRLHNPTVEADFGDTLAFVAQHREADEIVLSAMTPPAYLALGRDNLVFLAGMEGTARVASYTQRAADGRLIDYWVGVDAVGSVADLCTALAQNPDGWILIDTIRLQYAPAFAEPVVTIIRDATNEVYHGGMGSLVLRIKPTDGWGPAATATCPQ